MRANRTTNRVGNIRSDEEVSSQKAMLLVCAVSNALRSTLRAKGPGLCRSAEHFSIRGAISFCPLRHAVLHCLICILGVFAIDVGSVDATSFGKRNVAIMDVRNGVPAICLPNGAERISVVHAMVTESDSIPSVYWAIRLINSDQAILMQAGDCIEMGIVYAGYETHGNLTSENMIAGQRYSFSARKLTAQPHYNVFYEVAFFFSVGSDGSRIYMTDKSRSVHEDLP